MKLQTFENNILKLNMKTDVIQFYVILINDGDNNDGDDNEDVDDGICG